MVFAGGAVVAHPPSSNLHVAVVANNTQDANVSVNIVPSLTTNSANTIKLKLHEFVRRAKSTSAGLIRLASHWDDSEGSGPSEEDPLIPINK